MIEWDSDNDDGTDYSSDVEGDEALYRDIAKLQVPSPIATAVRPRRLPECGLVRSKAFLSHLSLLDSRP